VFDVTTKTQLLEVIRKRCLECCGGSYQEIENCTSGPNSGPLSSCSLWAYRLGVDPNPSEARKEAGKKLAMKNKVKVNVQLD